jgi:hypothetical protein
VLLHLCRYLDDSLIPSDPAAVPGVLSTAPAPALVDGSCVEFSWWVPGTEPAYEEPAVPYSPGGGGGGSGGEAYDPFEDGSGGGGSDPYGRSSGGRSGGSVYAMQLETPAVRARIAQLPRLLQEQPPEALYAFATNGDLVRSLLRPDHQVDEARLDLYLTTLRNQGQGQGLGQGQGQGQGQGHLQGQYGGYGPGAAGTAAAVGRVSRFQAPPVGGPVSLLQHPPPLVQGPGAGRRSRFGGGGGAAAGGEEYSGVERDPYRVGGGGGGDDYEPTGLAAEYRRTTPSSGGGGGGASRFPTAKVQVPCRFFNTKKGCQFGDKCGFGHFLAGVPSPSAFGGPSDVSGSGGGGQYYPGLAAPSRGGPTGGGPGMGHLASKLRPMSGPGSRVGNLAPLYQQQQGGGHVPEDGDPSNKRPKRFN